jgi:hypothetical protein
MSCAIAIQQWRRTPCLTAALIVTLLLPVPADAHSGPPFPIVTSERRGAYTISIWTDPDATDNGVAGGQFWIIVEPAQKGMPIPASTTATVSVRAETSASPSGPRAPDSALTASATPVRGDLTNQFAAVVLDHEGPYAVHVTVHGPLGDAQVDSRVDATYDLRPAPYMLGWYLGPFVLAGLLWSRLLLRRRAAARAGSGRVQP